jgi:hypothetical protein
VTGIDITLANVCFGAHHPRVRLRQLDGTLPDAPALLLLHAATAAAAAAAAALRYDVVLDDASHRPQDQLQALRVWGPHVAPGGIFVVEDIAGQHADAVRAALAAEARRQGGFEPLEWHDLRHVRGQFDDIVAVLRRAP